jgi:maltose/moltooligosaccharide transporter
MTKPRLSFRQVWNMCFGFFGIQIAFGLQNANASRIFQTLGAAVDDLPLLWIAAPVTGLLVQPIVGYWSDRTWGRLGRRRPYFFYGALLTTAALFVMPHSPVLWVAAIALWVLDASINVTMEPFRAFVGDLLPEEQRTLGFATQSFFIGVGAVFASALPWMLNNWAGVSNVAAPGEVPESVRLAFYVGAACLLVAVMWTVFSTREYSPEQVEAFEAARTDAAPAPISPERPARALLTGGLLWAAAGLIATALVAALRLEKELYILTLFVAAVGGLQLLAGALRARGARKGGLLEITDDLFNLPRTMRQLAVVQFFSWFGLFAMWIYTTPAVTAFHYGATDAATPAYNEGADWVGVLFAAYNGVPRWPPS